MCLLTLAGIALALALLAIERVVRPIERELCARLGVIDAGYGSVVRGWASAVFLLATGLAMLVVASEVGAAVFGRRMTTLALSIADWWTMLAVLVLIGVFLVVAGTDPEGWGPLESDHEVIALHWLIVPCALVAGRRLLAVSRQVGQRRRSIIRWPRRSPRWPRPSSSAAYSDAESGHELAPGSATFDPSGWAAGCSVQASLLAVLAVMFTRGAAQPATVAVIDPGCR